MANQSYPVSSIIGGVSTLEYAIRMDSQATDQKNCLLSPKYGLCKRPNSNYLATIKKEDANNYDDLDCVMHPLHYGSDTRILIGFQKEVGNASGTFNTSDKEKWALYDEEGNLNVINHFPSSSSATTPAINKYALLSEDPDTSGLLPVNDISFATLGDYTFINHAHVRPQLKDSSWTGYTETYESSAADGAQGFRTINNDEVFSVWIKAHQVGKQTYDVTVDALGVVTTASLNTDKDDTSSANQYGASPANDIKNDTKYIAGVLAYQLGATGTKLEATSLATASVSSANDAGIGGTSVITGRVFDDMDPLDNEGSNFDPSQLSSVAAEGGRGASNVKVCFKTSKSVAELPPRSWEDHTVKITDAAKDGEDSFYMRFINDEQTTDTLVNTVAYPSSTHKIFGEHTSFGSDNYTVTSSTDKLPRQGHWEEYCGVGVQQEIDSATMPHVLTRRSDGSFVLMEARGSFQVNTTTPAVTVTASANSLAFTLDAGFSDDGASGTPAPANTGTVTSALIVGDTLTLSHVTGGTFPTQLQQDKTYYIKTVTKAARVYTVTLSETEDGDAIALTADQTLTNCKVTLTTYENEAWAKRQAGDDSTNPTPDILSRKINELFVYQNRLGFASDKEVLFSGINDPFSLFRSTVRDLLENDPFTVSPSDSRGDIIKSVSPFGQNLVVLTNEAQHIVRSLDGRFSAKAVEIVAATHSTCDFDPHPIAIKDSMYFTSDFGGVWEFSPSRVRNNAFVTQDISDQIPGFLPAGSRKLLGSSKHRMLFYLNERPRSSATSNADDTSSSDYGKDQNLYVYTFADNAEGARVQSAWTKWMFNSDKETGHTSAANTATGYRIVNMAVISDRLYLVTTTTSINNGSSDYDTEFYLEYIDLDVKTPDSLISESLKGNFDTALLDRRTTNTQIAANGGSISFSTNTTITMPWKFDAQMKDTVQIVTSAGTRYTLGKGSLTAATSTSSTNCIITVAGVDLTSTTFYIGFGYDMSSTYGPFAPRIQNVPLRGRQVYVRGGRLTYTQAQEFKIDLTHGATTYTEVVNGSTDTALISGEMYFGIRQHMPSLSFTIKNETPWNAMFQGLMYDLNIQEVLGG